MSTVPRSGLTEIPLFGPCSDINPKGITPPLKKREVTLFAPFNGISGARLALEQAGLIVKKHFISEIDRYANEVTMRHYPDSIQLGDITKWREWDLYDMSFGIDFMIFGSPCQDMSIAKANRKGLKGSRSGLFWDALGLLRILHPTYWIMENVNSMSDEDVNIISAELGYFPRRINSRLVSGQSRERLYWTDFKIKDIKDRGIVIEDIAENVVDEKYYIKNPKFGFSGMDIKGKSNALRIGGSCSQTKKHNYGLIKIDKKGNLKSDQTKASCVTAGGHSGGNHSDKDLIIIQKARGWNKGGVFKEKSPTLTSSSWEHNNLLNGLRRLTPVEFERLQTFPDNWTEGITNSQRYKCCGNAFTVAIIQEIAESIPFEFE